MNTADKRYLFYTQTLKLIDTILEAYEDNKDNLSSEDENVWNKMIELRKELISTRLMKGNQRMKTLERISKDVQELLKICDTQANSHKEAEA